MKTILFVDDHEVLARLSCEILETQGYRAVSAYSGADALAKFEKQKFDMLVTDYRMEGMNGLELARKLRKSYPDLPVIIVTGYGPIDCGTDADACLSKDDLFPALLDKIRLSLGEGERQEQDEERSRAEEIKTM
jgi:CheY-like chemotaxis protein